MGSRTRSRLAGMVTTQHAEDGQERRPQLVQGRRLFDDGDQSEPSTRTQSLEGASFQSALDDLGDLLEEVYFRPSYSTSCRAGSRVASGDSKSRADELGARRGRAGAVSCEPDRLDGRGRRLPHAPPGLHCRGGRGARDEARGLPSGLREGALCATLLHGGGEREAGSRTDDTAAGTRRPGAIQAEYLAWAAAKARVDTPQERDTRERVRQTFLRPLGCIPPSPRSLPMPSLRLRVPANFLDASAAARGAEQFAPSQPLSNVFVFGASAPLQSPLRVDASVGTQEPAPKKVPVRLYSCKS